jgi:uncharacterized protein
MPCCVQPAHATGPRRSASPTLSRLSCLAALALVALSLADVPAAAGAPSFDCAHAATAHERAICSSPALASADRALADAYKAALAYPDADARVVQEEQQAWLQSRDRRCRATDATHPDTDSALLTCLKDAYDMRIEQLTVSVEDGCRAVASALRSAGNAAFPAEGHLADIAAATSGSALRLDEHVGGGYALTSTLAGSGACQGDIQLNRAGAAGIPVPTLEAGGCGDNAVRLASINGVVGVLGEVVHQQGPRARVLSISLRRGAGWTRSCALRVTLATTYRVAFASCRDGQCGALPDLVRRYAEAHHEQLSAALPSPAQLSPPQQAIFGEMLRIAAAEGLEDSSELPHFGSQENAAHLAAQSHCQLRFDGSGSRLFPVITSNELLLGRIGTDGMGLGLMSGGPDDTVAIYRLAADQLEPVAGFCVASVDQSITDIAPWSSTPAAVHTSPAPGRAPLPAGATGIFFDNQSHVAVEVLWKNAQGNEQLYRTLQPGQRYLQATFAAHRWVVRNAVTHDVMSSMIASEQQQTLVISDRDKDRY